MLLFLVVYSCNGGDPEAAWDYFVSTGIVTGGLYNSSEVSYSILHAVIS